MDSLPKMNNKTEILITSKVQSHVHNPQQFTAIDQWPCSPVTPSTILYSLGFHHIDSTKTFPEI